MLRITKLRWNFHRSGFTKAVLGIPLVLCCAHASGAFAGTTAGTSAGMLDVLRRGSLDGEAFSAMLPVKARKGEPTPAGVLREIEPVLREAGFQRSLSELAPATVPVAALPVPDLQGLAEQVCRDGPLRKEGLSRKVCAALRSGQPISRLADESIRAVYGVSLAEWKAGLERPVFQYAFTQVVKGVPIEGAVVSAFHREGETVSLVHGALFDRFAVVNALPQGPPDKALEKAGVLLARQYGDPSPPAQLAAPELVLLPLGEAGGRQGLQYTWRALLGGGDPSKPRSWMIWVEASTGALLQVAPQWSTATVQGVRWRRDPGLCASGACTEPVAFEVDPLSNGKLALQRSGVLLRVDVGADGFRGASGAEIAVPSAAGFLQNPIARYDNALCAAGNRLFRQVNAYSHVYSLREIARTAGTVPAFPEKALQIYVDVRDPQDGEGSAAYYDGPGGVAKSALWMADGQGFVEAACPAVQGFRLNGAQDATVLAHETSHLLLWRLQERRPKTWCGSSSCSMPSPLAGGIVHGLADGLAFLYTGTNCFAGWSAKNLGGVNASLNCTMHSEAGGFPRLAEVANDRFPDHRKLDQGEYGNGQIAAAALWEIRKGMYSKAEEAGLMEMWIRLLRSLWSFGSQKLTCSSLGVVNGRAGYLSCDRDVFLQLQDLERKMVTEWAAAPPDGLGRQTVSKVLSGWAKAGLFLTPFQCLDGDDRTLDPACLVSDTALDAVIEIDDRAPGDDPRIDGVVHPEVDVLKRDGPPPGFQVWTGPAYRFAKDGSAGTASFPCGQKYEIEAASDPLFKVNRWTSGVKSTATCQADLILDKGAWDLLRKDGRLYYRVTTTDQHGSTRISTAPGNGAFTIEPPFAVINATGKR